MPTLFLTILNMSLIGTFVILAICIARLPLKKAPKIFSYCLWAVAGFRLIVPFSFESVFGLIPFGAQPFSHTALPPVAQLPIQNMATYAPFTWASYPQNITSTNVYMPIMQYTDTTLTVTPFNWMAAVFWVWLAGFVGMVLYGVVTYLMLKRKMSAAVLEKNNIYRMDGIPSPFVLGVLRPRIYIPTGLPDDMYNCVVLHEETHIRRRDYLVKFVAYFILCVHWFNPFVWLGFVLMESDMEMACDEYVLKRLGSEVIRDYSLMLVSLGTRRNKIAISPLAFGEGGIKERVRNVLKFRKATWGVIAVAAMVTVALGIGLGFNRSGSEPPYESMFTEEIYATFTTVGENIPLANTEWVANTAHAEQDEVTDAASIIIFTQPPHARIYVDYNVFVGYSTLTTRISPGTRTITARRWGYEDETITVEIEPNSENYRHLLLTPSPNELSQNHYHFHGEWVPESELYVSIFRQSGLGFEGGMIISNQNNTDFDYIPPTYVEIVFAGRLNQVEEWERENARQPAHRPGWMDYNSWIHDYDPYFIVVEFSYEDRVESVIHHGFSLFDSDILLGSAIFIGTRGEAYRLGLWSEKPSDWWNMIYMHIYSPARGVGVGRGIRLPQYWDASSIANAQVSFMGTTEQIQAAGIIAVGEHGFSYYEMGEMMVFDFFDENEQLIGQVFTRSNFYQRTTSDVFNDVEVLFIGDFEGYRNFEFPRDRW